MGEYEGWSNYPTWAVNLWLSNDEHTYRHWRYAARAAYRAAGPDEEGFNRLDHAAEELAREMKDELEEAAENRLPAGTLFSDLLDHALGEVDWLEVARSWLEEWAETDEPPETEATD